MSTKDYFDGFKDGYDFCADMMRKRVRSNQKKQGEIMIKDLKNKYHGTQTGYTYGCRCDKCKAAHAKHSRKYYKKKRDS